MLMEKDIGKFQQLNIFSDTQSALAFVDTYIVLFYFQLTYRQPAHNGVLTDQLCLLYSLVILAYANTYNHLLVQ